MGFREVSVYEIKEVLRLWISGKGFRTIDGLTGIDRKTVRRYAGAAQAAGLSVGDPPEAVTDDVIAAVVEAVRPVRPGGHGASWELLVVHRDFIARRLEQDLTLVKVQELLHRHTGVEVPYPTLHRFCQAELSFGRRRETVRLAEGDPGEELQVDFGRMGLLPEPDQGRARVVQALIFTAVYSRHLFVFLTFRQTLEAVICGFEAAWVFFGGVFRVVIPDNIKAIVSKADPTNPRFTDAFLEYSQSRGFVADLARVRHPRDKARVERAVSFVRESFFRGDDFADLADAQRRAEAWCRTRAGMRIHGTTQHRPLEVFEAEEAPLLLAVPETTYDLPVYAEPKVHPDRHIEVAKALYSIPGELIGEHVSVRADRSIVRVFWRGRLIKTHPRQPPGGRSTDPADLPSDKAAYAMRDLDKLRRMATSCGAAVGAYAKAILDTPLPWTKMRQVYRLLGLARHFGNERLDEACRQALVFEAVDVSLVARMLERARETIAPPVAHAPSNVVALRFARPKEDFEVSRPGSASEGGDDDAR